MQQPMELPDTSLATSPDPLLPCSLLHNPSMQQHLTTMIVHQASRTRSCSWQSQQGKWRTRSASVPHMPMASLAMSPKPSLLCILLYFSTAAACSTALSGAQRHGRYTRAKPSSSESPVGPAATQTRSQKMERLSHQSNMAMLYR